MIKINQTYWEVQELDCEGRSVVGVHSRWATEDLAKQAKKGNFFQSIRKFSLDLNIMESEAEYEMYKQHNLRNSALKKLTKEEIKALGIKE